MSSPAAHCQGWQLMEASSAFRHGRYLMAILAVIGAVLAAVGIWYYRIKMLGDVGRDVADLAGRARGAYRMHKFKQKADGATLNAIDEPALAAAVFLYALANEDKASLYKSVPAIRSSMALVANASDLDDMLAYAEWAARDVLDPRDLVPRFKTLWREKLAADERRQFIGMAETVVAASPYPEPSQTLSVDALRTALSP
jgi:uncharacterized tellurite resistance protein B-like protein